MKKWYLVACLLCTAAGPLTGAATFSVPREKISLVCTDTYFKTSRVDFVLADEDYGECKLALRQRWSGRRTFFVIPRVSATLFVKDKQGHTQWLPLSPLVNPGADPLHLAISSAGYDHLELTGRFGKLSALAGEQQADTVGAGGKITVCATFDVTARFRIYQR